MARKRKKAPPHGARNVHHLRERLWKYRGHRIHFWCKVDNDWFREQLSKAGVVEEKNGFWVSGIYMVVFQRPERMWMYLSKAQFRNEKGEKIGIRWFTGRRRKRGHSSRPVPFEFSDITFPVVEGALLFQRGFQREVSLYAETMKKRGCNPNTLPSFHSPTRAERLAQRQV
jgi:hypothetical protein